MSQRTNKDACQELRREFRAVVETHGIDSVLGLMPVRFGFETAADIETFIHTKMNPNDIGTIRNALRSLKPKKEKRNKYKPDGFDNDSGP